MPLDVVVLSAILLFGAITSYTDTKQGKIKNVHVAALLAAALILNVFVTKSFVTAAAESAVNFAIALLLSFGMYYFALWSEGDAKLFTAFALLLPVTSYSYLPLPFFPALSILTNTFVPAALFIIIMSLREKRDGVRKIIKESFLPASIAKSVLFLFGFGYGVNVLSSYLGFDFGPFITIIGIATILAVLRKINKDAALYIAVPLGIVRVFTENLNAQFLYGFVLMLAALMAVQAVFSIGEKASFFTKGKKKVALKMPFAPFLFFGALFTYLTGADVFFVLLSSIKVLFAR